VQYTHCKQGISLNFNHGHVNIVPVMHAYYCIIDAILYISYFNIVHVRLM